MSAQIPAQAYLAGASTSTEALDCLRRDLVLGTTVCEAAHRVVVWQALLLSRDDAPWQPAHQLKQLRNAYLELEKAAFVGRPQDQEDPLSESPAWATYYKDQERRATIKQDCTRIFPDEPWFQAPQVQKILERVLFIWCKTHASLDYRQGMHELAGVVLWVTQHGNSTHIEADTYTLFDAILTQARPFYEVATKGESPISLRCSRIQHTLLNLLDPTLAEKLRLLEIEPQMYALKWLRLLFLREFALDEVLVLWDLLFAVDRTLALVDYIACAMLLKLHDRLMLPATDYSGALTLLMRFPHPGFAPAQFVPDALALKAGASGKALIDRYAAADKTSGEAETGSKTTQAGPNATAQLAGVAGYSLGAFLHQTERLGLNHYVKGTLTELSRGVTEARQVLSRQSTDTPNTPTTPSAVSVQMVAQQNKELAGHLALVISNIRAGGSVDEQCLRLEQIKYVLQGRKQLADLKPASVLQRVRPSTAPVAPPPEKKAADEKTPATGSSAPKKKVTLQDDFGFLL